MILRLTALVGTRYIRSEDVGELTLTVPKETSKRALAPLWCGGGRLRGREHGGQPGLAGGVGAGGQQAGEAAGGRLV